MKKASDVFKSIRFAKSEPRDKSHKSTDEEGHYTVGEKEYVQQLQHVKKMAMMEETPPIQVRSLYAQTYAKHGGTISKAKNAQSKAYSAVEKKHGKEMRDKLESYHKQNMKEDVEQIEETKRMSAAVKLQRAFERAKEQRERSERAGKELLKPKQPTQPVQKEEVEQLDELSPATKSSYKKKAQQQVKELEPHAKKGEYKDIAKNMITRRLKGLSKIREEFKKEWSKTGKEATHRETGEKTYEYQELGHDGKPTGKREYRNQQGKSMGESVEQIDEKNVPTSPEKWAQAKAQAKAKFDVYPSAYANGWAAKKYKEMGGGWKSVSEAKEEPPFDPDPKPRKKLVVPGKHGEGYSTARHLARMAMQKQSEKMKKPIKEEEMSKKAQIVKSVAKKKKESADTFQKDPIISKSEVKM